MDGERNRVDHLLNVVTLKPMPAAAIQFVQTSFGPDSAHQHEEKQDGATNHNPPLTNHLEKFESGEESNFGDFTAMRKTVHARRDSPMKAGERLSFAR